MSSFSTRVSSLIAYFGSPVSLRKITVGALNTTTLQATTTYVDYPVNAAIRFYKPHEISGLVQDGDRQVKIASDDIAITPRANDKIVDGSKTYNIISVNTRAVKGSTATYIMQVRG